MRESPRVRRLRSDYLAMQHLALQSSILKFHVGAHSVAGAPEFYVIEFHGQGLYRDQRTQRIATTFQHRVEVKLTASYPRSMPDLRWKTAIYHPNISAGGVICLGGYGTHWTPGLTLDEMCQMLWEMVRYANYDVDSPYNREAAEWAKTQTSIRFPLDPRPLRDLVIGRQQPDIIAEPLPDSDSDIVDAEVLFLDDSDHPPRAATAAEEPDILFLD